jgi:hypothetical protein
MRSDKVIIDCIKLIRSKNLLTEWNDAAIAKAMFEAVREGCFAFTIGKDGEIDGVGFGQWKSEEEMHVSCLVGKLKYFVKYLRKTFPQIQTITAFRKGKNNLNYISKVYSISQLYGRSSTN